MFKYMYLFISLICVGRSLRANYWLKFRREKCEKNQLNKLITLSRPPFLIFLTINFHGQNLKYQNFSAFGCKNDRFEKIGTFIVANV